MGDTWVTDMQHFLENGELAWDIPGPALNLALFQGAIVAWMTALLPEGVDRTNVRCRREPRRRRCRGEPDAKRIPEKADGLAPGIYLARLSAIGRGPTNGN